MTTKLYLAYGSNMNRAQMARRCPKAKPLRAIVIDDARLVFRGVADIEFCRGASVPVVLWEITAECERSLDRFEGVAGGVYEKKLIPLDNGEQALTYVMCSNGIAPPTRDYYERIKQGYADFNLDLEPLDTALKHSHVRQAHSPETRRRQARNIAQGNVIVARKPMHVPLSAVDPQAEPPATQGELPLRKPVARPLEGYNYSEAAKRGSKNGQPTGRKVVTDGHGFGETEATNTGKVRMNQGKRSNTRTIKPRHKNLSDWMKEKGYS